MSRPPSRPAPISSNAAAPSAPDPAPACRPFSDIQHCDCDRKPHSAKLVLRKQETNLDLSTLRTLKFPKDFKPSQMAPATMVIGGVSATGAATALPAPAAVTPHAFSLLFEPFASTGYAVVSVTSHQPCADAHFPPFAIDVYMRTDQRECVSKRVVHRFSSTHPIVVIDKLRSPVDMFEDFDAGRTVTVLVTVRRVSAGPQARLRKLIARVSDMRRNEELTDVTLRTSDGDLRAHRVILASRCEYFESMFCGDLSESQLETIDFPDESHATLALLLDYIYTDKLPHDDNLPYADLFIAADKYRLEDLMHIIRARLYTMPIPALVGMIRLVYSGQVMVGGASDMAELEKQVTGAVRDRLPELKLNDDAMTELFMDRNCHRLMRSLL